MIMPCRTLAMILAITWSTPSLWKLAISKVSSSPTRLNTKRPSSKIVKWTIMIQPWPPAQLFSARFQTGKRKDSSRSSMIEQAGNLYQATILSCLAHQSGESNEHACMHLSDCEAVSHSLSLLIIYLLLLLLQLCMIHPVSQGKFFNLPANNKIKL